MADSTIDVILRLAVEGQGDVKKLGDEAAAAAEGVDKLADAADDAGPALDDLPDKADDAAKGTEKLGRSTKATALQFAILASGLKAAIDMVRGYVRAAVDMARTTLDAANQLSDAAARSDVLVDSLAGLRLAAGGAGLEFEGMAEGLNALPKRIADAAAGVGESAKGFERLGIAVRTSNGEIRETDAVLRDVARAVSDGADAAAVAQALGESFGPRLRQALAGSTDGLETFIAAADQLRTTAATEVAGEMQRGIGLIREALLGLGATTLAAIGGDQGVRGVVDVLLRVIVGAREGLLVFVDALRRNFDVIRTFVGAMRDLLGSLQDVARNVGSALVNVASVVASAIVGFFEPTLAFWQAAGEIVAGGFGNIAQRFGDMLDDILALFERALGRMLQLAGNVADQLGLSDEFGKLARLMSGFRQDADAAADAFGDMVAQIGDSQLTPFRALAEAWDAATGLDTEALLSTLGGGSATGPDGSSSAGGSGKERDLTEVDFIEKVDEWGIQLEGTVGPLELLAEQAAAAAESQRDNERQLRLVGNFLNAAAGLFLQAARAIASAAGALLTGDAAAAAGGAIRGAGGLASGLVRASAPVIGGAVGASVGSVVLPGIGTVGGAAIGALVTSAIPILGDAIEGVAGAVADGIGQIVELGDIGAAGVAEKLDEFGTAFLKGLDTLPTVIAQVIPDFAASFVPALAAAAPEIGLAVTKALIEAAPQLARAYLDAGRAWAQSTPQAYRSALQGTRVASFAQGSQARAVQNFRGMGGPTFNVSGVIGSRDEIAKMLNRLYSDRGFGYSRG